MKKMIWPLLMTILSSCGSVKYYIVRHAEKAVPSEGTAMNTPNDPPLSVEGRARAIELRERLKGRNIRYIFSTNTIRTIATAQPMNELRGATHIELYNSRDSLDYFIEKLRSIKGGNCLIVGHSNTVDDIVNKLCGRTVIPGDLPDTEYDNLYILTKRRISYKFETRTYGAPTN